MIRRLALLLAVVALASSACGGGGGRQVVLMTHDSFLLSKGTLEQFTADTGIEVTIVTAGDAGAMVNQAILTRDNPVADVMYGVDNTFLTRALEAGIFTEYVSPLAGNVPGALRVDPRVTPIDFGDVCLNYDKRAFTAELPPPAGLADLADSRYRSMLVVEDPATSSPGLAFLLATVVTFGENGDYTWLDFWSDLRDNDVRVASGWEEAYYGSFSGGSPDGDRPLVVSYASSPPAEIVFATEPISEPSTATIPDGCFRQVEYAAILAGTDDLDAAGQLVDFMLSPAFQEDVPLSMFVFPATPDAAIPQVFLDHTVIPAEPLTMDPARIESGRKGWIEDWARVVLR